MQFPALDRGSAAREIATGSRCRCHVIITPDLTPPLSPWLLQNTINCSQLRGKLMQPEDIDGLNPMALIAFETQGAPRQTHRWRWPTLAMWALSIRPGHHRTSCTREYLVVAVVVGPSKSKLIISWIDGEDTEGGCWWNVSLSNHEMGIPISGGGDYVVDIEGFACVWSSFNYTLSPPSPACVRPCQLWLNKLQY